MPTTYIKKKETPRYSLEDVRRAVEDVTGKKKTFRQASEQYGVPTSVIFHRIKGRKVSLNKMGGGTTKAIPDRVEQHFVNCLKTRARMGYPCHKEEFKQLVGEYVSKLKIKTPFRNNIPGDCWYRSFMKRHPSLSLKKPELLQKSRTDARRPHVIYDFYDLLSKEIQENDLADKPRYIFNADESGFHNDPCKLRAIGEKGSALSRLTGGSGRESTSVLACAAADGTFLPPCIVFKGVAVQARWVSDKAYPGTLFGATKNGWMEEPTFHNWLVNGFIPFIDSIRHSNGEPDHKVILIYDGHSSHISIRIVEDALKANIILIKFPSHLTDRIQPLDKCVFGPVKTYWDKALVEHGVKQMGKGSAHLTKEKFTELLGEVWGKALTSKNIISGFNTTGVFPVDATKFPRKLFNEKELTIYHNLVNAINDASIMECDVNKYHSRATCDPADNVQESVAVVNYATPHSSNFEDPIEVVPTNEILTNKPTTSRCDSYNNGDFEKQTKSIPTPENSSPLLNKILKLISLDTTTNETAKARIVNAIMTSDHIDDSGDEIVSPNKYTLDNLFKIQNKSPQKNKKIVIPRLKVATYGEVLTSDAVKERLKKAEEDKNRKQPKKIAKVEKSLKNKGQGKRTKTTYNNEKDNTPRKKQKQEDESKEEEAQKVDSNELDNMQKRDGPRSNKQRRRSVRENSESEEELMISYAESDNSDYNIECEFETTEECEFLETTKPDRLIKGNFVIVKFRGGKRLATTFRYLCMVDSVDEEDTSEILVTSLKSFDSSKQVFALNEKDMSCVSLRDIIGVLPEPLISLKGERIFYKFPKPIDIYEKV